MGKRIPQIFTQSGIQDFLPEKPTLVSPAPLLVGKGAGGLGQFSICRISRLMIR